MAKDRFKKCQCNLIPRNDGDFLLTTHHPQCTSFDPGTEIKSLEMQCKHFMDVILELRTKVRELKSKLNEVDSLLDQ
jgi:hypothetical protein